MASRSPASLSSPVRGWDSCSPAGGQFASSPGWAAPFGIEVVPDAPHVAGLHGHVREIRLARSAPHFDAMHSRLKLESRDRRRRAVVLAIDVNLAARLYRDDELRRGIRLLLRIPRDRTHLPQELRRGLG